MTLARHMPLVAAGRPGYRNSLCFRGRLRRSTDSHVLRAAWHELLDRCEIAWPEKTCLDVASASHISNGAMRWHDHSLSWNVIDMDPEFFWTDASHTNRKNEATAGQRLRIYYLYTNQPTAPDLTTMWKPNVIWMKNEIQELLSKEPLQNFLISSEVSAEVLYLLTLTK